MSVPDIVLWVGHGPYPEADDYIKESLTLGCCKRVPILPKDIVPGQSRAFLAHDDGKTGHGCIFGFFIISGVEVILDDPDKIAEYQEKYSNLNVKAISTVQAIAEPRRLCGHRIAGAVYLVSQTTKPELVFEAAAPLAEKADVKGDLVVLLHRIPYPRIRFRGWRYMEPQFLEKYDWPQRILPVKRTVKIEPPKHPKPLPLFGINP